MNIVFRADASAEIGTGHVARCLALASVLAADGDRCVFVCRPAAGDSIVRVEASGFEVARLSGAAAAPSAEAAAFGAAIRAPGIDHADWLVVDHYGLGVEFETAARAFAERILTVDDLAGRRHDCDVLLDHNFGTLAGHYDGLVPARASVLAGPRFALLRPEFAEAAAHPRERDGSIRRILVCFGGMDPTNETEKALAALTVLGETHPAIDVVLPEAAPHRAIVAARASTMPGVVLHGHVEEMAALMSAADLMVGAGGVTLLERAAVGLPSISVRVAENQARGTRAAAALGVTRDLGSSADVTAEELAAQLRDLLGNPGSVAAMSRAARAAAGSELGAGPATVVGLMRCIAAPGEHARLRPLRAADRDRLRAWRNSCRVRLAMTNQHVVSVEEHAAWFSAALADESRCRFVFECGGVPLGFVTFRDIDRDAGTAQWGFYVGEQWAPRGTGGRLGILALDAAFDGLGLAEVRAEVLRDNTASLVFHARMGFREAGDIGGSPDGAAEPTHRTFALAAAEWAAVRPALVETYFGEGGAQ